MKPKKFLNDKISWAIYDFANTIFSASIITLYFPIYFTELTGVNRYLGVATTLAMLLAGLATPIAGRICDQSGRPEYYLKRTTFLCIGFTFFLALFKNPLLLFLAFIFACFFFHLSLVFYNALLPKVALPHQQGKLSGLGVGLGYFGIVLTLPLMHWIESLWGTRYIFIITGILFFAFSLPLFRTKFIHSTAKKIPWSFSFILGEWQGLYKTFLHICRKPKILLFFGGNFFILDALNSTIAWFAVYSKNFFDLERSELISIMITLNIFAFLWGLIAGYFTDKINSYLILVTASLALVALLLMLTQNISLILFKLGSFVLGAYALAGIWTAGRKVLIEIAPPEKRGEYFGVYGLATKISILGSFFYGLTSDISGMQAGLWVLVFPACCGTFFLFLSAIISKDIEIDYGN